MLGQALYGVVALVVLVYLVRAAYIKVTHPFWSRLPIHHSYNILNRVRPPGVIADEPAERLRWVNDTNIKTVRCDRLSKEQKENIVRFLEDNTATRSSVSYKPTIRSVFSYYNAHSQPAFVSMYREKHHGLFPDDTINPTLGIIMSRPLTVRICGERLSTHLVENLVLGKGRGRDADEIAPELIYTTVYRQPESRTCMFVRRGKLGIPVETLTSYKVLFFSTLDWENRRSLPASHQVKAMDVKSLFTVREALRDSVLGRFKCVAMPAWDNISELVATRNLFIYTLSSNGTTLALYLFKDPATVQSGGRVIECIGSANLCGSAGLFASGFNDVLRDFRQSHGNVLVHRVADSATLIDAIQVKHRARDATDHHVFLYNYVHPRVTSGECLMIY